MPPTPEQQLDDDADWQDRRRLVVAQQTPSPMPDPPTQRSATPTVNPPSIEATEWQRTPTGEIILTATAPEPQQSLPQSVSCNGRQ